VGEFDDLMVETLEIYPKAGNSSHGPTFATDFEEDAYVEPGARIAINQMGQEVLCNLFTVHNEDSAVKIEDECVWDERRYVAVTVEPFRMDGVVHHVEVSWRSVARTG
jgi:hypothetical protein